MPYTLLLYLLQASLCLLVFSLVYKLLLSNSTHFAWMRFYLVASVTLSICLPLMHIPFQWYPSFFATESVGKMSSLFTFDATMDLSANALASKVEHDRAVSLFTVLSYLLLAIYLTGFLYKVLAFGQNLLKIRKFITHYPKEKEGQYWLIHLPRGLPSFSFLHYVFLSANHRGLAFQAQQQIKEHELVHVRQRHTLDLLLFEIAGALFWFNPLMIYLKKSLQEVHEYLADAAVAGKHDQQKNYAYLLLKLATETSTVPLSTSFSGKQISRRIMMLSKARSLPYSRFTFTLILPMAAILLWLCSCMEEPPVNQHQQQVKTITTSKQTGKKIGQIIWQGNTVYDDNTLNHTLDLQAGDLYNKEILNKRLDYHREGSDISSLYMDHGYLFFNLEVEEKQAGPETVDLVMHLYEGEKIKIGAILIKGNQQVSLEAILALIPFKTGAVFSRSKLIEAQRNIAAMGYFDPQQIMINPIPDAATGSVAIEFVVKEMDTK